MKKKVLYYVKEVINLLSKREKRLLIYVFIGAIIMGLIQIIGIGSVMPFMAVAANPDSIHTNEYLNWAYLEFGFKDEISFLVFLGIAVVLFLVITNVTKIILHYIKVRFTTMRQYSLGRKLMESYLRQHYAFFLHRNSFEFIKNIRSEIQLLIQGTLIQVIEILTKSVQVFLIVLFLFIVNPISTLLMTVLLFVVYGAVYILMRGKLKRLGEERFNLVQKQSKIVSEAFWGIKEVKILGAENIFLSLFDVPSKRLARNKTTKEILGDIPKFMLETVLFSSIMIYILISIVHSDGLANAATSVTLYSYSGYRLMPALQGLFKAITKLRYSSPTAEKLLNEFHLVKNAPKIPKNAVIPIKINNIITLVNIVFSYPGTERKVINGLSLDIKKNESIGLVGSTGSGKTTLIDILLGLHFPEEGKISVDGINVEKANIRAWQMNLGYVPQTIYLSNDSLAANIAFGVPNDEIDMEKVVQAAQMAQLEDFIVSELPEKYDTFVGERGVRLSGGQRQRIGIARALYRNPEILIMDEATSALDGHTEDAVMNSIDSLMGTRTIIMIAHRLSTLRNCDRIYLLKDGQIEDFGTYEELTKRNNYFKKGRDHD